MYTGYSSLAQLQTFMDGVLILLLILSIPHYTVIRLHQGLINTGKRACMYETGQQEMLNYRL